MHKEEENKPYWNVEQPFIWTANGLFVKYCLTGLFLAAESLVCLGFLK